MFNGSNNLLTYLRKPSVFRLKKIISDDQRKQILEKALIANPKLAITRKSSDYRRSWDMILRQREQNIAKYQNSILWSPRFTPWHFKYYFFIPALFVLGFMLYLRYIVNPKRMLQLKKKHGIKFKDLQGKGWLQGWLDEYEKPDKVLRFQAYTLADMEKLYKDGILTPADPKNQKKNSKFIRGDKQFVLKQFKRI